MSVWPGNRTLFLLVHTLGWCGGVTPSLLTLGAALGSGWRQVSDSVSLLISLVLGRGVCSWQGGA